jgi:hypothetical protein
VSSVTTPAVMGEQHAAIVAGWRTGRAEGMTPFFLTH